MREVVQVIETSLTMVQLGPVAVREVVQLVSVAAREVVHVAQTSLTVL